MTESSLVAGLCADVEQLATLLQTPECIWGKLGRVWVGSGRLREMTEKVVIKAFFRNRSMGLDAGRP